MTSLPQKEEFNIDETAFKHDDDMSWIEEKPVVIVDVRERECLARAIYWEARNQSIDGKYAVGFVVINRVNAGLWEDSICKVVFQGCQFSWVCSPRRKMNPEKSRSEIEIIAWAEAIAIANELILAYNNIEDITNGSTHFHAHYVKPKWAKKTQIEKTVRIDDHIFYRLRMM